MFSFGNNIKYSYNSIDNNSFCRKVRLNDDLYKLNIKKLDSSKIIITCNLEDDVLSLYDYSIELTFDEFYDLGFSFKQCKNIDDIFNLLQNVFKGIEISIKNLFSKLNSDLKINLLNNEMTLYLEIPLLTGEMEEIKITFQKSKRDINMQFENLKLKYKSLKKMIYDRRGKTEDEEKFLNTLKDKIKE